MADNQSSCPMEVLSIATCALCTVRTAMAIQAGCSLGEYSLVPEEFKPDASQKQPLSVAYCADIPRCVEHVCLGELEGK